MPKSKDSKDSKSSDTTHQDTAAGSPDIFEQARIADRAFAEAEAVEAAANAAAAVAAQTATYAKKVVPATTSISKHTDYFNAPASKFTPPANIQAELPEFVEYPEQLDFLGVENGKYKVELPQLIKQYLMVAEKEQWSDTHKIAVIDSLYKAYSYYSNPKNFGVNYAAGDNTWHDARQHAGRILQLGLRLQAHWNVTLNDGARPISSEGHEFYNDNQILALMLKINPEALSQARQEIADHLKPKASAAGIPVAAGSAATITLPGTTKATGSAAAATEAAATDKKDEKSKPPKPHSPG